MVNMKYLLAFLVILVVFMSIVFWYQVHSELLKDEYTATIFRDGDIAVDANKCRIVEHDDYQLVFCK